MKKYHKLFQPLLVLTILGIICVSFPPLTLRSEEIEVSPTPISTPNIKISIKDDFQNIIETGKNYSITWKIEELEEEQKEKLTHTDIHWAYLADLNTPEEINDYKKYPNKGREFTYNQGEYTDEIYLSPYDAKPPAIMLVIHVVVDSQDYILGPVPIDIVFKVEEQE